MVDLLLGRCSLMALAVPTMSRGLDGRIYRNIQRLRVVACFDEYGLPMPAFVPGVSFPTAHIRAVSAIENAEYQECVLRRLVDVYLEDS